MKKDFLSIADLSASEIMGIINSALALKQKGSRGDELAGRSLALLFEKPSLRTRVSFDIAMWQLGGHAVYLSPAEVGLGGREPVKDVAHVLSRYVSGIAARTFLHSTIEELAKYCSIPVINALSDVEHPCQALGDLLTIYETRGDVRGLNMAFIGDGNNVANSLLYTAAKTGMNFTIASPSGYNIAGGKLALAQEMAQHGAKIACVGDPEKAVADADVVYTDVWTSMGQEAEQKERQLAFAGYQVSAALLRRAKRDAIFMHPLPAHRGEEVEEGLLYSPGSEVFRQAENRLHAQKALLLELLA